MQAYNNHDILLLTNKEYIIKKASNRIDMTGKSYGNWFVIEYSHTKGKVSYWKCRCETCKQEYIVDGRNVRSGRSKQCVKCGQELSKQANIGKTKSKLTVEESTIRYLSIRYKKGATKRNKEWNLTDKEVSELVFEKCHYCGAEPFATVNMHKNHGMSKDREAQGWITYNGIDRVDSSKGYEAGNVVTCCTTCNKAKMSMSVEEFKEWIERVHSNIKNF